ncbi:aquaporin [Chlorella sorokiniana]|uniref:Aquaporin n=1 Tax=Chlorella sorokiniana TaxID=3076 RepID=A0A2P6TQW1_CHLSO|nr:aquaporin [Chlorella sorokiniana]|eukprot:PRW56449.1 aquaporin [Chlorella sorokiniana]
MASRGRRRLTAGFNPKAVVAELMAATLFIYIGCGTATTFSAQRDKDFQLESTTNRAEGDIRANIRELSNNVATTGSWGITTALAFGLAITGARHVLLLASSNVPAVALLRINPAVTLSLLLSNNLGLLQAVANMATQIAGAILGAGFLYATIPGSSSSTLASNQLSPGVGIGNALCGEIVMTFVLCSVVLEVTTNKNEA